MKLKFKDLKAKAKETATKNAEGKNIDGLYFNAKGEIVNPPRPKHVSRASRLQEQIYHLTDSAEALRNISEKITDELTDNQKQELIDEANAILENVDFSELECLTEEMQSWRDNIEEKFSQTEKYSMVDECCSNLESVDVYIENVEDIAEIDDRADELEEKANELEYVEFPGMF